MKVSDRFKLAFSSEKKFKNTIFEIIEEYGQAYITGQDVETTEDSKISAKNSMKLTAVFGCVRVLAETLSSCPVFLYQKNENGGREQVKDSSLFELLHYAPNPDMTPSAFKETGMVNQNLGGNFYAQKVRNKVGNIIQLRPIEWQRVRVDRDKNTGELIYFVDENQEPYTRNEILHIPGFTLDGYMGVTPIGYAQNAIKAGASQDSFTNKFYENGVTTSGIFTYPNELSDPAFKRLKEDIKKNYSGLKNTGTPLILEGGGTFKEVSMKLADAQFIESKRFTVEDICRIYRVPQHLVQMLERSTNNNIEHQSLEFVMYTMLPWFKRWEENLNLQLLDPKDRKRGQYWEFKVDSLLRGDAEARAKAYAQGRQWGWLSVNDIKRLENQNPIPNGDIYLQPINMAEAGSDQQQASANARLVEDIYNMIIKERRE